MTMPLELEITVHFGNQQQFFLNRGPANKICENPVIQASCNDSSMPRRSCFQHHSTDGRRWVMSVFTQRHLRSACFLWLVFVLVLVMEEPCLLRMRLPDGGRDRTRHRHSFSLPLLAGLHSGKRFLGVCILSEGTQSDLEDFPTELQVYHWRKYVLFVCWLLWTNNKCIQKTWTLAKADLALSFWMVIV